jgi:hypothetical protein
MVVGERPRGGPHPVERFRIRGHLQATLPVARSPSPVSVGNWEGAGVLPDVPMPAGGALDEAYQRALAHVLSLGEGGAGLRRPRKHRQPSPGARPGAGQSTPLNRDAKAGRRTAAGRGTRPGRR